MNTNASFVNLITRVQDSLQEFPSTSRGQTRHCLINVIKETRNVRAISECFILSSLMDSLLLTQSVKLPIEKDDPDVIQTYMHSNFFYRPVVIPLWSPSPIGGDCQEISKSNVCVGDVGYFTDTGGFHVLFNIFLPASGNAAIGFKPPDAFEPYGPVSFSEEVSDIKSIPRTSYQHCYGDFSQKDSDAPQNPQRLVQPFSLRSYLIVSIGTTLHCIIQNLPKAKAKEGREAF